uniref:BHLH domain-containing protein n=1 Tax=Oryza glumipatula TaxID=40148 RepID=A0A0D9Z8E2_9ORYZ
MSRRKACVAAGAFPSEGADKRSRAAPHALAHGYPGSMRWLALSVDIFRKGISLNLYCRSLKFGIEDLVAGIAVWVSVVAWQFFQGERAGVLMVWQPVAQTRFRVFKHENGIAVRVIACFQPSQDCQAEYFRHLLKPKILFAGCFLMGEKVNPWCHWSNPPWTESSANNLHPPDVSLDNTNSVALPTYLNSDGYIYSGVAASMPSIAASVTDRPVSFSSRFVTTLVPSVGLSTAETLRKRPLVFFHNVNNTFTVGPLLSKGTLDTVPELQGSNETNVTDVGAQNTECMHENTEEIDALLCSDSDEGCLKVQELNNRVRKYPMQNDTMSVESVASAGASQPAKKRRLSSGTDRSVVDTASSARPDHSVDQKHLSHDDDAQSCCIGEVESDHQFALREGEEAEGDDGPDDRKRRRERIQETVAALRKIVPGGIAKDATAVLDEAICYLKYLKLKVKTLGAVSL